MKKFLKYFAAGCMVFSMTSCLDVEPQSEITDAGYWKEEGQFSSANTGLQAMFRDRTLLFSSGVRCVPISMVAVLSLVRQVVDMSSCGTTS